MVTITSLPPAAELSAPAFVVSSAAFVVSAPAFVVSAPAAFVVSVFADPPHAVNTAAIHNATATAILFFFIMIPPLIHKSA